MSTIANAAIQMQDANRTEIRTVGNHRPPLVSPWFIGLALRANPMNQE